MSTPPPPLYRRVLWAMLIVAVVAILAAAANESWRKSIPTHPTILPRLYTIADFRLTERSGRTVRRADLLGKIWVADFIFTSCRGPCPLLGSRLQELQQALGRAPDVRLVSISVDPETDTPAVLQAYAQRFQADPEKWWFLTGETTAIHDLVIKNFLLPIESNPGGPHEAEGAYLHSSRLVLVDRQGVVRGLFDGLDSEAVPKVLKSIGFLMEEAPETP
jgi:protein SCO1/2